MRGMAVTGWGTALPERVVTNAELETRLDTSDAWITERTGIRERRFGGTTSSLAVAAGRQAMERAGVVPSDVGALVLATSTPDQTMPATSAAVADGLGLHCGAFDVNAACAGFVYALVTAAGLVSTGVDRVLVVGSETMSRILDEADRGTAIIFGDGAGAVVVEAVPGERTLLGWDFGTDGSLRGLLDADVGGFLQMNGKEIYRRAVRATVDSALAALERAKVGVDDVALFVPHQANVRILEAVCSRLGLPLERTAVVLDRTGNTSAASVPLALADAADAGRLADGDLVLTTGFGAGMTWASAVFRWGPRG